MKTHGLLVVVACMEIPSSDDEALAKRHCDTAHRRR
jgi:hypothetical protein